MHQSATPPAAVDRNLLVALLALQMDFVNHDTLIEGLNAWVQDKSNPIGHILVQRGIFGRDVQVVLESLADKHLERYGGDTLKSLASLRARRPVRLDVSKISDGELRASLSDFDEYRTQAQLTCQDSLSPSASLQASWLSSVTPSGSSAPRFRVLRHHRGGGLGDVFVAQDEELQREVALKEIKKDYADHAPSRSRFLLEATVTGGLEHPGVVPVYGLGAYPDGRPYYAMRFIRGVNLLTALRQYHAADMEKRDPPERALELRKLLDRFVDMCNAIAYAHSRGVLHRDLKPDNVMLGPYGETLVVDWGLAKVVGRTDQAVDHGEKTLHPELGSGSAPTHAMVGTPPYMSPEQAAGRLDQLGPATDVYSLGATLYHILTGKRPFEGTDTATTLSRVQRGEFPRPRQVNASVPVALEAVCLKAMAINPEDRYPARGLAEEIERWLADEPVAAYAESLLERVARWTRRHRSATLAGGIALLLVAVVSMGAAVLVDRERVKAVAAQQDAQLQRQLADERFQLAVQNTARVSELAESSDNLGAGNATILEKVLSVNADNLDALVRDGEDQARADALALSLAKNLITLAKLRMVVGKSSAGAEAASRAVAVLEALSQNQANDTRYQAAQADALDQLAYATAIRGNSSEALEHYRRALSIRQQLAEREPLDLDREADVATSHTSVGNLLVVQGYWDRARIAHEQAAEIRAKLVAARPQNGAWRSGLAWSRVKIDNVATQLGEEPDLIARYREAIDTHEQLLHEQPNNVRWKLYLADLRFYLGHALQDAGRSDEAAAEFASVRETAVPQSLADPRHTEWMRLRIAAEISMFDIDDPKRRLSPQQQHEIMQGIIEVCRERVEEDNGDMLWKSRLALANRISGLTLLQHANNEQDRQAAEAALRSALAIGSELAALDSENHTWMEDLRLEHDGLRQFFVATGQQQLAVQAQVAAGEIRLSFLERRATRDPDNPYWRVEQARAHRLLAGSLVTDHSSIPKGIENFQASVQLLQPLVQAYPKNTKERSDLAAGHWYLAVYLATQNKFDEAVVHSRAALRHYLELQEIDPAGPTRLFDLAQTYSQLEFHLRSAEQPDEAQRVQQDWRAVRARVYTALVKRVLQPPTDNVRRHISLMRRQYYENRLAAQRTNLQLSITLYWFEPNAQRLLGTAEAAIDLAATIAEALQWSRQSGDDRLAIDHDDVERLLQKALAAYRKARASDRIKEEATLIAAIEDAVRAVGTTDAQPEASRRDQSVKVAQLLGQARELLGELQPQSSLAERTSDLARAIEALTAQPSGKPTVGDAFALLASQSDHAAGAPVIAASSDGRRLATASQDKTVRIRDATSAQTTATLGELEQVASCLCFTNDGRLLAAGSGDGHIAIWDVETQERKASAKLFDRPVSSMSFSADGKLLAITAPEPGRPGAVRFWDVTENRELPPIGELGTPVYLVSFLATSPQMLVCVGLADDVPSAQMRVIDCDKRSVIDEKELDLEQFALANAIARSPNISDPSAIAHSIAVSNDGAMLAVSHTNAAVTIHNVRSGEPHRTLKLKMSDAAQVVWLSFSAGDRQLVSGDLAGNVAVWHTRSGKLLGRAVAGDGAARAVFAGDGTILASARNDVLPLDQPEVLKIWRLPVLYDQDDSP